MQFSNYLSLKAIEVHRLQNNPWVSKQYQNGNLNFGSLWQDQIIADALRKKKAAIFCIKAAAAKKSADLNSDRPMEVSTVHSRFFST